LFQATASPPRQNERKGYLGEVADMPRVRRRREAAWPRINLVAIHFWSPSELP